MEICFFHYYTLGTSLSSIYIRVGNSSDVSIHVDFAIAGSLYRNRTFHSKKDMIGRYVSVQMKKKGVMRICEVEVWGFSYKGLYICFGL